MNFKLKLLTAFFVSLCGFLISTTNAEGLSVDLPPVSGNAGTNLKNDFARLRPEDKLLIDTAAAAVNVAPKLNGVWRNYWQPKQSLIVYKPGETALLISAAVPPPSFQSVDNAVLPEKLRGRTYLHRGALAGLVGNFNTDYRLGSVSAVAVKLEKDVFETLAVLFHERFHKFQIERFARTVGADGIELHAENSLPNEVISNSKFVAAMELERRMLARAVEQYRNRAQLNLLLRQYLAVRRKRSENLPLEVRETELNLERKEGTASIVGFEAAFLATNQNRQSPSAQLKMFVSEPPESLPFGQSPFERFRARSFGSGAAIAWILTRMKFDWRKRSQKGASFETLLSDAIKFNPEDTSNLAQAAFEQHGYKELLAQAEEWKTEFGSELTVEDFYRLGRVRLILKVPSANKQYPGFVGKATGIPSQPAKNIVINAAATLLELDYQKILFTAEKYPYMLDLTQAPKIFQAVVMLDEMPQIEGYEKGSSKIEWTSGGKIEGKGLKLILERPADIEIGEDTITINIKPQA